MRYFIPVLLTVSAGIAAGQVGAPTAVLAQQYTYAPVGIASGTTIRMNVANVTNGTTVCAGNFAFVNSDGTTIKNQNFTANAGQTVSYSLLVSEISGSPASAEVRGVTKINRQAGGVVQPPGQPPIPMCSVLMSLEVVDISTGQTRAILTNPAPIFAIPVPLPVLSGVAQ